MAAKAIKKDASSRTTADSTTVEDDELQMRRFDDLVELLLAAGYFRARIASLSPFDKVIGGLTWCIVNSHVDVDVDLFFQEEANIGFQMYVSLSLSRTFVRHSIRATIDPRSIDPRSLARTHAIHPTNTRTQ